MRLLTHTPTSTGIHHVNPGTLTVLQSLLQDRDLTLYDGTRLLRHDRYAQIRDDLGLSDEAMVCVVCSVECGICCACWNR